MARRVDPKPAAAAEDSSAAAALSEIKPDVTLVIGGRTVTIREYGFFEGLEVAHRAQPLIAAMFTMCQDGNLQYSRIRRLFGVHKDLVIEIAARAADVEQEWVRDLERKPADAELFLDTWFGVNSSFFVHEVVVEMREERQRAAMSTGSAPSQNLQPPASGILIESEDSPSDS
ncbi:DUF6631 family protein [Stenotrophomonas maltophilia]|uniref:DUF6631 family protein n=1 Tax=Stenotrophomonas maltophilia TaxID=40324 RepID=UPI002ACC62F5|nr:DUF6631 family protein [Stenotrophomonas maltophilia]MDZ5815103.1 DUF6631 family protein [Stenotrophomonas maltophilia]